MNGGGGLAGLAGLAGLVNREGGGSRYVDVVHVTKE